MMRTLLIKELRTLLPFALLIAGMMALIMSFGLGTEFPDTQILVPAKWLNDDRGGIFALLVLFGLIIGAGLLVNESENGTLSFLEGLPISRRQMFTAKIVAALLVLSLVPLLGSLCDLWLDWISRDSTDGAFPWRFLLVEAALEVLVAAYLLSAAVAFSFFRRWFALIVGLIFWGFLWVKESGAEWISLLNPYDALEPVVLNDNVRVPWRHVGVQLSVSAVLLLVAWLGFRALGDRIQHAVDRFQRHRILQGIGTGIRFLAPVVWIAAMAQLANSGGASGTTAGGGSAKEVFFGRRETKHYEFLFRTSQEASATPMIDTAEDVHAPVAAFFGAPPTAARIVVDLASPVAPHAAGQTNWTKIRLPFDDSVELDRFQRILGHETAHVYIEQLSDLRATNLFRYSRFLHEGVATYVEQEYFATEEQQQSNRRAVAAAWSRGAISFATLSDDSALRAARDGFLVYPFGEVFVRALVETHGQESVPRLIRALGRKNAPVGLKGMELWRDTMQAADISLDRVEAVYESRCKEHLASESEYVARFPRINADVSRENDDIVIKPRFEGTSPCRMICMVHVDDLLGNTTRYLKPEDDGRFRISRFDHPSDRLRYMLGWVEEHAEIPVFEPKVEVAVP